MNMLMNFSMKKIGLFHLSKKTMFNNSMTVDPFMMHRHNNSLRVISTPEFPVPYYQRIVRHPPSLENVTISLDSIAELPNEGTVERIRRHLKKTPHGLKILDHVDNHVKTKSFVTHIRTVTDQCNIYADDLVHYLDAIHEENCKIVKAVDLADALK